VSTFEHLTISEDKRVYTVTTLLQSL